MFSEELVRHFFTCNFFKYLLYVNITIIDYKD